MSPLSLIRKNVFGLSQANFANMVGVAQGTVSRWERATLLPSIDQLATIRNEALRRKLEWNDAWFFEQIPTAREAVQ